MPSNTAVTVPPGSLPSDSSLSVVSTRATTLDVFRSIYGDNASSPLSVDTLYEAHASVYENPLLTATSRSVIHDIHHLTNRLSSVDVPGPLAALYALFRLQPPQTAPFSWLTDEPLFQALRVWRDIDDIHESESFDGHRKAIVEHTLHILFLPGIHLDSLDRWFFVDPSESLIAPTRDCPISSPHIPLSRPWLPIPGTSLSVPSPFHFKLDVVTRLSFNEQGRVTHHRDSWDVKDVLGLFPGISLAQWMCTRMAAAGLSYASRMWMKCSAKDIAAYSAGTAYSCSEPLRTKNGTDSVDTMKFPEPNPLGLWGSVLPPHL